MNNIIYNKAFYKIIIVIMVLSVAQILYSTRDILSTKLFFAFVALFFAGWSIMGSWMMLTMIDLLKKTEEISNILEEFLNASKMP